MRLKELAEKYGTDKLEHLYCPRYEHHLPSRDSSFSLLEIGIFKGASLRMWREWFPNAEIYGVDINPGHQVNDAGIQAFVCDATKEVPEIDNLQVIIDDGSHNSSDIIKTFDLLWPRLKPGGWYVVEDLNAQWNPIYGGGEDGSAAIEMLHEYASKAFTGEVSEFHAYLEIAFIQKKGS